MFTIPSGGCIIDTPGIRSIIKTNDDKKDNKLFYEIEQIALNCKFKNCHHISEPECAVIKALENGVITKEKLASYHKIINIEKLQASKKY